MTQDSVRAKGLVSALNRPIVVLLGLQLMGGMMLSPHRTFFPIYVQELGHSAMAISALTTARMVMAMVASLVGGTLSDSLGRKWTLLLGNLGFIAGSLLFLTPSVWWIGVLWALSGLGMGLRTVSSQSYLMDTASRSLGMLTALYNWGYTLGGALGSPIVGYVLDNWDYRVFGITLALFAGSTVIVNALFLPRSSVQVDRGESAWKTLTSYSNIARRTPVVLLVLLRFLPTVYWGMAIVFIPLLLDAAGATKTAIALYAMVSQVVASLAQVVVGRAADRFGVKWPTVVTFFALVTSALGTGLFPGRLWGIAISGTLGAAAGWSLSTLLPSLVTRVAGTDERGRTLGWVHLWWNVAMIAGSMLGGALYERWTGLPFIIAGLVNLLSIVFALVFFGLTAQEV